MTRPLHRPKDIPADAMGFFARRADRPERWALFRPDGTLSNTFAHDETPCSVAEAHGLQVTPYGREARRAIDGHKFHVYLAFRA